MFNSFLESESDNSEGKQSAVTGASSKTEEQDVYFNSPQEKCLETNDQSPSVETISKEKQKSPKRKKSCKEKNIERNKKAREKSKRKKIEEESMKKQESLLEQGKKEKQEKIEYMENLKFEVQDLLKKNVSKKIFQAHKRQLLGSCNEEIDEISMIEILKYFEKIRQTQFIEDIKMHILSYG